MASPPLQYSVVGCLRGFTLNPSPPGMPISFPLALDKSTCIAIMKDHQSMDMLLEYIAKPFGREDSLGQALALFCAQNFLAPLFASHPKHGRPCLPVDVFKFGLSQK